MKIVISKDKFKHNQQLVETYERDWTWKVYNLINPWVRVGLPSHIHQVIIGKNPLMVAQDVG